MKSNFRQCARLFRRKMSPFRTFFGPKSTIYPCESFFGVNQGWAGIPVPGHSQEWRPLIPVPELWEWIFSFPSRSRILGMDFFIPFPFPNFGNGFFPFPSRSWIDPFKVGNQKGKWEIFRCLYLYSNIFSFLYISYQIKMGVLKSKLHMWRCPIKQHPKFLCEKIISQPWLVQKPFLFHPDIVQPNY